MFILKFQLILLLFLDFLFLDFLLRRFWILLMTRNSYAVSIIMISHIPYRMYALSS